MEHIFSYNEKDVYAKISITSNPEISVITQYVEGNGNNPIFNETLQIHVPTIDSSLKCEIYELCCTMRYDHPDKLLAFTLIPLSEILSKNGTLDKEFCLSLTDLFHSPSGFVHLSMSYTKEASPDKISIPPPVANGSANTNADLTEFEKTGFADPKVVKENHMMVTQYIGLNSDSSVSSDTYDLTDEVVGQNTNFQTFQAKQPIVVDSIAPSKVTCQITSKVLPPEDMDNQFLDVYCVTNPTRKPNGNHKTAKIPLTQHGIEKQFGKTMKEASHNLNVSLSTLKRKCKAHGILEWRGPKLLKRNANESCNIQISTNEANVTTQEPSTININKNTLFIKAEYVDDMIKFNLPISQATFATVEKTIGVKFKLSVGTFKLKYLDEDGDWILLSSNEEMNDCIHSLKKSDRIMIRLRVLPSPQPVSYPCL